MGETQTAPASTQTRVERCAFCSCEAHGVSFCAGARIDAGTGDSVPCPCEGGKGVRFIEVPYELATCWLGVPWFEIEAASGLPASAVARLTPESQSRVAGLVVWTDVEAYASAHGGRLRPRPGRAWLGAGPTGLTRQIVGYMNPPVVVGARKRWRW